jgi:DNA-binding Lrp family transcriptional regulator
MPTSPIYAALARTIQRGVPLVATPFTALSDAFGLTEHQVLTELRGWQAEGKLVGISAVLEPSAIGYEHALGIGHVPEHQVKDTVRSLIGHPLVGRIWGREHHFNVWFAMTVPVELGFDRMLDHLGLERRQFHPLPLSHLFKTGVELDFERRRNISEVLPRAEAVRVALDVKAKAMLRALQKPIALVRRPFRDLAQLGGVDEATLLAFANRQIGRTIRRYGALFSQRNVGVCADTTTLWKVVDGEVERVGEALAAVPEVSHCEARKAFPGFPYTLHTVVHAPDRASAEGIVRATAERLGIDEYCVIHTAVEFKNTRPSYFEVDPMRVLLAPAEPQLEPR